MKIFKKIAVSTCAIGMLVSLSDKKMFAQTAPEKSVDISWNKVVRFQTGMPVIEGKKAFGSPVVNAGSAVFSSAEGKAVLEIKKTVHANVSGYYLTIDKAVAPSPKDFTGFFFKQFPGFKEGVEIWRYKPWNSWSRPAKIGHPSEMKSWDVQFTYWKYADGTYAAVMPLGGNGYRSTLGTHDGMFGCKSIAYAPNENKSVPLFAIGFGKDPYVLFAQLYESAMTLMGTPENLRKNKTFPEVFEHLGWCTWNASEMGRNLNDAFMLAGAKSFKDKKIPLGFVLYDDGYYNSTKNRMNTYAPNPDKFPNGFKDLNEKLKKDYGVKYTGIWHAINGHWDGINKDSTLGKRYKNVLFTWTSKLHPEIENSDVDSFQFIRPESGELPGFYDNWHTYFKSQGMSFIKVDNQLVTERMCVNNYPIMDLASQMHKALNQSVAKHFNGAIINCMDMTSDAYMNFGPTAVARVSEDYFPYIPTENYNLEKGNAAAHVTQALYNTLYFSQMVYPDFDIFQSHNPNAGFHAIARAISGGPVYITDTVGGQAPEILLPLIYKDSRIIRADLPGYPTEDCLFQVQDKAPLKVFSKVNDAGLLAIFNAADADMVKGAFRPSDVRHLKGEKFLVYEHFSKKYFTAGLQQEIPVALARLKYLYYNIVPIKNNIALIGLVNKYNAPKTIVSSTVEGKTITARLKEAGSFAAYLPSKPSKVFVNGQEVTTFDFSGSLFTMQLSETLSGEVDVKIEL